MWHCRANCADENRLMELIVWVESEVVFVFLLVFACLFELLKIGFCCDYDWKHLCL